MYDGQMKEKPLKNRWEWITNFPAIGISFILVIVSCLVVWFTLHSTEVPSKNTPKATEHAFTVESAFDAILRSYDASKVCYTGQNFEFFVFLNEKNEEKWQGWFYVKNFDFKELHANGTLYILGDQADFIKANPDITNLQCAVANN